MDSPLFNSYFYYQACVKRKCNNMIEKGVDASCSEDESDVEDEVGSDAAEKVKVPGKTTKALIEKLKGQPDIKECFIPLMKLDVASNVLLKHLGYKWVGESIGTVKDKVYYSQVSWRTFFLIEQKDRKV